MSLGANTGNFDHATCPAAMLQEISPDPTGKSIPYAPGILLLSTRDVHGSVSKFVTTGLLSLLINY